MSQVDYKSNCGNMTAAVGPYGSEEGMVDIAGADHYCSYAKTVTHKYISCNRSDRS